VNRLPGWEQGILPANPTYSCDDDLPSNKDYPADVAKPDDVRLTLDNRTRFHVDLLLYHYPPPHLAQPRNPLAISTPWGTTQPACPPRETRLRCPFRKTPGGFIAFVAVHGRLASRGRFVHLYKTAKPRIVVAEDAGGGFTIDKTDD
jgi:hypothetical protein